MSRFAPLKLRERNSASGTIGEFTSGFHERKSNQGSGADDQASENQRFAPAEIRSTR